MSYYHTYLATLYEDDIFPSLLGLSFFGWTANRRTAAFTSTFDGMVMTVGPLGIELRVFMMLLTLAADTNSEFFPKIPSEMLISLRFLLNTVV
jgi:hypothetical protein